MDTLNAHTNSMDHENAYYAALGALGGHTTLYLTGGAGWLLHIASSGILQFLVSVTVTFLLGGVSLLGKICMEKIIAKFRKHKTSKK